MKLVKNIKWSINKFFKQSPPRISLQSCLTLSVLKRVLYVIRTFGKRFPRQTLWSVKNALTYLRKMTCLSKFVRVVQAKNLEERCYRPIASVTVWWCIIRSHSFLSLLVSKQQPTRKLCYFGCCTLIHSFYKLYNYDYKFSINFIFYTCFLPEQCK